jgi:hypothetical protein
MSSGVKFIRKNGHIIPIKSGGSSGKSAAPSAKAKAVKKSNEAVASHKRNFSAGAMWTGGAAALIAAHKYSGDATKLRKLGGMLDGAGLRDVGAALGRMASNSSKKSIALSAGAIGLAAGSMYLSRKNKPSEAKKNLKSFAKGALTAGGVGFVGYHAIKGFKNFKPAIATLRKLGTGV